MLGRGRTLQVNKADIKGKWWCEITSGRGQCYGKGGGRELQVNKVDIKGKWWCQITSGWGQCYGKGWGGGGGGGEGDYSRIRPILEEVVV